MHFKVIKIKHYEIKIFAGTFNTLADIRMKQWADQQLPKKSVEVGWRTLEQEFRKFLENAKKSKDHDTLFDNLKAAVVDEAMNSHSWEDKVCPLLLSTLIVIVSWYIFIDGIHTVKYQTFDIFNITLSVPVCLVK